MSRFFTPLNVHGLYLLVPFNPFKLQIEKLKQLYDTLLNDNDIQVLKAVSLVNGLVITEQGDNLSKLTPVQCESLIKQKYTVVSDDQYEQLIKHTVLGRIELSLCVDVIRFHFISEQSCESEFFFIQDICKALKDSA